MPEQYASTKLSIGSQAVVRRGELLDRGQVKRVALLRPIDADQQNMAVTLEGDSVGQRFFLHSVVAPARLGLGRQESAVFGPDKSLCCVWAVWGNDRLALRVATRGGDPFL